MNNNEKVIEAFNEVLGRAKDNNTLALLADCGWNEYFPEEDNWSFWHPHYEGIVVYWTPGLQPRVSQV